MSEPITTTKEELTEAFRLWNIDALASPDKYDGEVSAEKEFAERQTELLLEYLASV